MKLNFDAPLNSLSLGNVSYNFLRELYKRNTKVSLFAAGDQADLSSFDKIDPDFFSWVKKIGNDRLKTFSGDSPTLKIWHINGSEKRFGKRQFLYTFYETDSPTQEEIAIINSQEHTFFSSSESCQIFQNVGCKNVSYVPLGFDEDFYVTDKQYLGDDVIHFGLIGKFERRKNTQAIINLWLKKYGNNPKYQLTCLVNNPFFKDEQFQAALNVAKEGKHWNNLNILPFLRKNSDVNELMNSIDVDLSGISNGEGWNLPSFNATALGKWSVVSNCSSHKDWANAENSILIEPFGKQPCYDNFFFREGVAFNQGQYALLSPESIVDGFERAEKLAKTPNSQGEKLKSEFTYSKSIDQILKIIK